MLWFAEIMQPAWGYLISAGLVSIGLVRLGLVSGLALVVWAKWRHGDRLPNTVQVSRSLPFANAPHLTATRCASVFSLSHFQAFVEQMPVPVFVKDLESRTVYVNPCYDEILGSGWLGKTVWDCYPAAIAKRMVEDDQTALEMGSYQCTEGVPAPDGSGRVFQTIKFALGKGHQPEFLAGFGVDVTHYHLAEKTIEHANAELAAANAALEHRQHHMQLLLTLSHALPACTNRDDLSKVITNFMEQLFPQYSGLVALSQDERGNFRIVTQWGTSPLAEKLTTVPCHECRMHRQFNQLVLIDQADVGDIPSYQAGDCSVHFTCVPIYGLGLDPESTASQKPMLGVLHLYQPNGQPLAPTLLELAQSTTTAISLAMANIELHEMLLEESVRDPLTQVFNRRHLDKVLRQALEEAQIAQSVLSVLMIDVDHFKGFNDIYGHAAGDAVLHNLGQLLLSHTRKSDIACRYGGEEFTVLLPGATLAVAGDRAEQIRQAFADLQVAYDGHFLQATVSVGVAAYPMHGSQPTTLLEMADAALYEAKTQGRDRVVLAEVKPVA